MSDVPSLTAARWKREIDPRKHLPRSAFEVALADFEASELPADEPRAPDHVMILFGWSNPDGTNEARYFQAGAFDAFGQSGLAQWLARKMAE